MAIRSYADSMTEMVASGKVPKGFPADLARRAVRKLTMIDNARDLIDLRSPPGNHLEALKADRHGQHSIRITINGGSASYGRRRARRMSRLSITIEGIQR